MLSTNSRPSTSAAFAAGEQVLRKRIRGIALAGRLRVSEDRAVSLLQSFETGTILTLLRQPKERRDPGLSAAARDAVIDLITEAADAHADSRPQSAAATLGASLDVFSRCAYRAGERRRGAR